MRVSCALPLGVLGALTLAVGPLQAQGYRVDLDARLQGVSYRGWQLDSIPVGSVVVGSDGLLYTPDGIGVTCVPAAAYCTYYGSGAKVNAMPASVMLDFSAWDIGVKGMRLEGNGRLVTDFQDGPVLNQAANDVQPAWPGAQPELQLAEAYLAYEGDWVSGRVGRMTSVSRFGYVGYDGVHVRVAEPKGRIGVAAGYGLSLARGALVPWTDASLNPLAEFRPGERERIAGFGLDWNLPFVRGRVLYEKEWGTNDQDVSLTSSELVGGDLTLRLHPSVSLAGGLDYDLAWGSIGNADGSITAILPKRFGNVTVGGRRYRPRFPLWSIWSAFSPVAYNAYFGQIGLSPIPQVQLRGRLENYSYEETGATTTLVRVDSDGWRYGVGATYRYSPDLHATFDYQAGLGPGAQALTIDGGVFWRPVPKLGFRGSVAYVERALELRYNAAKLWQVGLDADASVYGNLRAFGGAWYLNETRERDVDAAGFDWTQVRFHVGLRYGFGSTVDRASLPPAILRIPEGGAR